MKGLFAFDHFERTINKFQLSFWWYYNCAVFEVLLLHDIIIFNISKINTFRFQSNVYHKAQIAKMEPFVEFKRKAVIIVPTHDNLRRRTSDAKRKNEIIHEVPFGDDRGVNWPMKRLLLLLMAAWLFWFDLRFIISIDVAYFLVPEGPYNSR